MHIHCRTIDFLLVVVCVGLAFVPSVKAQDTPPDERIIMIGHGHIDPVWRWTKDEGRQAVFATFRSALDRMNEFDGVTFVSSSAQFYQWVADGDPEMFREIQQRVQEGRWEIVGGWWIEPDLNAPLGESLVRQGLYGQQFFQQHFGRIAVTGFNPDSFGHPATLPQILRKQGMEAYYFMRPSPQEMPQLPAPLFHWQAPDGSQVLGVQILLSYGGEESRIDPRIALCRERYGETLPDIHQYPNFFGVSDHGGGPTVQTIQAILEARANKYPGMEFGTAGQYVNLMQHSGREFPSYSGELQHHARGCYSACAAVKRGNRDAECVLLSAEKLACMANVYADLPYPHDALTAAWKKVLFNQFHDLLAGTSIEQAYADALADYGYVQSVCRDVQIDSAHAVSQRIKTADPAYEKSIPFVVFNTTGWDMAEQVAFESERFPNLRSAKVVLRDGYGEAISYQQVRTAAVKISGRISLVFNAQVPAMGYKLYRLDFSEQQEPPAAQSVVTASAASLENDYVKVEFDPHTGRMTSYFDKKRQRQLLRAPAAVGVVLDDPGDTWGHHIDRYDQQIGVFDNAAIEVLEEGPLRARIKIDSRYGDSVLSQVFCLSNTSAKLDCDVTVDWRQKQQMLKLAFPTVLTEGVVTAGIPYGFVVRAMDGQEEPAQTWIDVSGADADGAFGLALLNDSKCGYSIENGELRLSVLRSSAWSQHAPAKVSEQDGYRYMDQGISTFRYRLVPHVGDCKQAQVAGEAERFLSRPTTLVTTNHEGSLPVEDSLAGVSAPNIAITAMKMAENGQSLVLRLVELNGQHTPCRVHVKAIDKQPELTFRAGEIKTLLIPEDGTMTFRPSDLLEK